MISKYDIRKFHELHADTLTYKINENDMLVHKETGAVLCSLDEFTISMRRHLHCDFECVYSCPASLLMVLRCKECGCVIFASDDAYDCDDNLCCPVCAGYDTHFRYYTSEEIASDEKKRKEVELYEEFTREQNEAYERREKRNGKYDWEICKGKIPIGYKHALYLALECENLFRTGLKGLRLTWDWAVKDDICFTYKKRGVIPLSLWSFKIQRMAKKHREGKINL